MLSRKAVRNIKQHPRLKINLDCKWRRNFKSHNRNGTWKIYLVKWPKQHIAANWVLFSLGEKAHALSTDLRRSACGGGITFFCVIAHRGVGLMDWYVNTIERQTSLFLGKDISRELCKHGRRSLQREVEHSWSLLRGWETAYPLFFSLFLWPAILQLHFFFFSVPHRSCLEAPPTYTPLTCETKPALL